MSIDDFVCLKYSDAVIEGTSAIWNLNPTYYSNQRSSVCFMSLEKCNICFKGLDGIDDSSNPASTLRININGQNQQITDNVATILDIVKTETRAIITQNTTAVGGGGDSETANIFTAVRNSAVKYSNPNPMRLLVSARPTTIKIDLQNRDFVSYISGALPEINLDEHYVILRFEYDDARDTQETFQKSFNKTLNF